MHRRIKSITAALGSLFAPLHRWRAHVRERKRTILGVRRLRRAVAANPALRLVVGSGGIHPEGWVPTDVEFLNLLQPADWQRFFAPGTLAAILAEHVWEHLDPADGRTAAATCFTFLRPGGYLRIAVPDAFNPDPAYRALVRPGGTGPGADDHRAFYSVESLGALLREVGFVVEPLEYFDAAGKFHAVDWDPASGLVHRSRRFDERNRDGVLRYTSLIIDARKPAAT